MVVEAPPESITPSTGVVLGLRRTAAVPVPIATIFVRHSRTCPHKDEFFKRCNCWKHLRWSHGGKQYRKAAASKTWAGAERAKRLIELQYENAGQPIELDTPATIQQAIDAFLREKYGQNLSSHVLKKYERELDRFRQYCDSHGRYFLVEITLPDLTDFRLPWELDYPSSITRQKVQEQERLKGFFRYAFRAGFISRNPAAAMSQIKVDTAPTLPLEPAQYKALLAKVPEVFPDSRKAARVRAIIRCMRHTGFAIRDAVCLERSQVRYDANRKITRIVLSRAKTGVDVSVPIPPDVANELLAVPNRNAKYVLWNTGAGTAESAVKSWQRHLRALFRAAGFPKGHPHQLRDTAAVEWLNAGVPLQEVSRLLGHSSIKTTEKYYAPWVRSRQDRLDALVIATWNDR